jgi:DNA-binding NtrC family response regulator
MMRQAQHTVKIVDDDKSMRDSIADYCVQTDCLVQCYASGEELLEDLDELYSGVIVCDLKMPGLSGLEVLARLQSCINSPPLIMMTAHGDVPIAVRAIQQGAYDFIEKPFDPAYLRKMIGQAVKTRKIELDNTRLRHRLNEVSSLDRLLLGRSEAMSTFRQQIIDSANTGKNTLLVGEVGLEKERVARAFHQNCGHADKPFIRVNCRVMEAPQLVLAFAEAMNIFDAGGYGTLFFDSVDQLNSLSQNKLLVLIEEFVLHSKIKNLGAFPGFIGSCEPLATSIEDFSIMSSLHATLGEYIIRVPPLRSRADDVFELFDSYLKQFSSQYQIDKPLLSAEDVSSLAAYNWPGNICQLKITAEEFVLLRQTMPASLAHLIEKARDTQPGIPTLTTEKLRVSVENFERRMLTQALIESAGSITKVCERLKIPRRTLNEKLLKHGLSRTEYI